MDISARAIQALFNAQPAVSPLERAIVSLRETRREVVACADHLEDADCRRFYLRDLFRSLPVDLLAWYVYPEDRIASSPQWGELSKSARDVGTWAMGPSRARPPYADEAAVYDALRFFEAAHATTDPDDEVHSIASNAASACRYLLGLIEQAQVEVEIANRYHARALQLRRAS